MRSTGPARPRIQLARATPEGGACVILRDHGPGVPQALHERIFDPVLLDQGGGQGAGAGLSISYNIIKDFGGDLTVADAPGGGAVPDRPAPRRPAESRSRMTPRAFC
jgi:two-component system, NtrC family, C4-dicarboxylate transport sensor histidine kinase DctB